MTVPVDEDVVLAEFGTKVLEEPPVGLLSILAPVGVEDPTHMRANPSLRRVTPTCSRRHRVGLQLLELGLGERSYVHPSRREAVAQPSVDLGLIVEVIDLPVNSKSCLCLLPHAQSQAVQQIGDMSKSLFASELQAIIERLLPDERTKRKAGSPHIPDRVALAGIVFILTSSPPPCNCY
jgi:hypothetical protein